MITRRGERDRAGGTCGRKGGEKESAQARERGERMLANTLKEIAGMALPAWNSSKELERAGGAKLV